VYNVIRRFICTCMKLKKKNKLNKNNIIYMKRSLKINNRQMIDYAFSCNYAHANLSSANDFHNLSEIYFFYLTKYLVSHITHLLLINDINLLKHDITPFKN